MRLDPNSNDSIEWSKSTQADLENNLELQLQQELRSMFDVDTQQYLQNYVDLVGQLQSNTWSADIQEIFRNIHTIKGGAVTVGADGVLYVATVLEDLLGDLRHLNPAPSLEDGQLGQLLLESGELLASSVSVWETGDAAKNIVQPAVERIQTLRAQVKEIYLPDWTDQKRLHQEFAEQGFDLVVLELELGVEQLDPQSSIPAELIESARQTLNQLTEIGHDLEFATGWFTLLEGCQALFKLQFAQRWRSHWPVYLKSLKHSAYTGGVAADQSSISEWVNHHETQALLELQEDNTLELQEDNLLELQEDNLLELQEDNLEDTTGENTAASWENASWKADPWETDSGEEPAVEISDTYEDLAKTSNGPESSQELTELDLEELTFEDINLDSLDINEFNIDELDFDEDLSLTAIEYLESIQIDPLLPQPEPETVSEIELSWTIDTNENLDTTDDSEKETPAAAEVTTSVSDHLSSSHDASTNHDVIVNSDVGSNHDVITNEDDSRNHKLPPLTVSIPNVPTQNIPTQVDPSRTRVESPDIQIPIPLGRLDQTAQYLVEALLTARASKGLHRGLQDQLAQLFHLAKESTQYITQLRQLQDDYALLDAINTNREEENTSDRLSLERYRQGYSTLNRLLENSLRLSELGLEAEKKFLQTTANLQKLERNMVQLQQTVEQSRLVPFTKVVFRARAILRDLTNRFHKPAQLIVQGEHLDLDAGTLSKLEPLLLHLLRNAYDHGLETPADRIRQGKAEQGTLNLVLQRRGNRFVLELKDDGQGINSKTIEQVAQQKGLPLTKIETSADLLAVICQPGFSTQAVVTDISGRGMGMDVVVEQVASLGGTLQLETAPGQGTTFRLQFPVPHLLVSSVLLRSGDRTFAIPTEDIATTNILANLTATPMEGKAVNIWQIQQGDHIEAGIDFLDYWNCSALPRSLSETAIALAIRSSDSSTKMWILADEMIDKTDLLIKPLPIPLQSPIGLLGVSLQPDGELIPVLETAALVQYLKQNILTVNAASTPDLSVTENIDLGQSQADQNTPEKKTFNVLVVDDAALMRRRIEASLTASGYGVTTCNDGLDAWNWLQSHPLPDLVITDIEMPNMDGFTLINRCRQAQINTPILVVSSRLAEEWYKEAQRLGASGYLTKGFSTSDLLNRVKSLTGEIQPEALHP